MKSKISSGNKGNCSNWILILNVNDKIYLIYERPWGLIREDWD